MEKTPNTQFVPKDTPPLLNDEEHLSQRLREAREYLGLSQETVAEYLNIPRVAVSAFESAKRKVSSLELKSLAKLYRRPYEYFLGADEEVQDTSIAALHRTAHALSPSDRQQVLRFAQFLKQAGAVPKASQSEDSLLAKDATEHGHPS